jgi:hypothetical protein
MPVNDETNQGAPKTALGSAFDQANRRGGAAPSGNNNAGGNSNSGNTASAGPTRGAFSFRNLGKLTGSPIGRTPASEVLVKLQKALALLVADMPKPYEVTLIPIDMNQTTALNVSVLTVVVRDLTQKGRLAFHGLILEGSVGEIAPKFEQIQGKNVEIVRTVADANDDRLRSVIVEYVARQFQQTEVLNADCCVVPRDFDVANEDLIHQLGANAILACTTEIDRTAQGFEDLNLAYASRDETLTVRPMFTPTPTIDATGAPVRNDITIDLSAVATNQQGQQLLERVSPVSRIGGFMEIDWDPIAQPVNAFQAYQQPGPVSFQCYTARFVMTDMQTLHLLTLPAQLMTLACALALAANNNWVGAFRSQPFSAGGVDLRDFGAVGLEANFERNANGIGARVDTKANNFGPIEMAKLVAATVRPGMKLSLDVPECGASTWYNGWFAAAAEGNVNANAEIIRAANLLTNGEFAKHFPDNGRVCVDENNRIHNGYYFDQAGQKRDIRDLDYLAVLNLMGEQDIEIARGFSDTYMRDNFDLRLRLSERKKIIQGLFPNAVITGFSRRTTFTVDFCQALEISCAAVGLDLKAVTPYSDMATFERATSQFTASTLLSSTSTSHLFSRGFGAGQASGQVGNRSFGSRFQ